MSLPQKLALPQMQTTWAQQLDPLLSNPITNGILLKNIDLASGNNSISHKLGRTPQGYLITGMHGAYASIYDSPSQMPSLTLVLNASAPTTIDLYVF